MPLSIDWNISSPQDLLNELRFIISYSDEFKGLPRKQRAIYAAIRGELIECLQEESDNLMEQCEIYLRIIFVLLDFLVDGNYTAEEHDLVSFKIKKMYDEKYH